VTAVKRELRPFWVSWWVEPGKDCTLQWPHWVTGIRGIFGDGPRQESICAAIMARTEIEAELCVRGAYEPGVELEFRFINERPSGWSPFSERFPRGPGMSWPGEGQP
jgi:hypothetical protein